MTLNFDTGNDRRIKLECTFYTFAAGNLTNSKSTVQTAVTNSDNYAFESLYTFTVTFNNVNADNYCVAWVNARISLAFRKTGNLLLFMLFNNIHEYLQ